MDFIFFFNGLVFITLAVICFLLEREEDRRLPWGFLGVFSVIYGLHEWLNVAGSYCGCVDTPLFLVVSTLMLTISFVALIEFSRIGVRQTIGKSIPRLIHLPFLLLACLGILGGWHGLDATIRYFLGFPAILSSAWLFYKISRNESKRRSLVLFISCCFLAFAMLTGLILPAACFLPGRWINYETFLHLLGYSVHLTQSFAAIIIVAALWNNSRFALLRGIRQQEHPAFFRFFRYVEVVLALIVVLGWICADSAGHYARNIIIRNARANIRMITEALSNDTTKPEEACRAMKDSPWVRPAFLLKDRAAVERAETVLGRYQDSFGLSGCYLIDMRGICIASSELRGESGLAGKNCNSQYFFREAIAGRHVHFQSTGPVSGELGFYVSYPVMDAGHRVAGVAVVKMNLSNAKKNLTSFDHCFLVDTNGAVLLSSQPGLHLATPWLNHGIKDGDDVSYGGEEYYVTLGRIFVGDEQWFVIMLNDTKLVSHFRLFFIALTFFLYAFTLFFLRIIQQSIALYSVSAQRKAILDASTQVAIIATDAQGSITMFNTGAERMLGYAAADVVVKCTPAIFHLPSELEMRGDELSAKAGRLVRGFDVFVESVRQGVRNPEWKYFRKDGTSLSVNLSVTSQLNSRGETVGYLFIAADITELQAAQTAIKNQLQFLQFMIDIIPVPVFFKDTSGKYTGHNIAFEAFMGKSKAEIIGHTVYDIIPWDTAELSSRVDRDLFHCPGTLYYEIPLPHADGTVHQVLINKASYSRADGSGLIGVITDFTERRKMEEEKDEFQSQLLQTGKMLSMGVMAGGVAHELNNPLAVVLGFAQLLRASFDDADPRKQDIIMIEDAAMRSRNIVAGLLEFSRKGNTDFYPVAVNQVIEKTLAIVSNDLKLAGITVVLNLDPALKEIRGNAAQIQQVFLNIMLNARDAMSIGGKLSVTSANADNGNVEISFADTGDGIPAEVLSKIFDPFYTTKPLGKGTGLGLSICYGIIESHHGMIAARSGVGKGTTFVVSLPTSLPARLAE